MKIFWSNISTFMSIQGFQFFRNVEFTPRQYDISEFRVRSASESCVWYSHSKYVWASDQPCASCRLHHRTLSLLLAVVPIVVQRRARCVTFVLVGSHQVHVPLIASSSIRITVCQEMIFSINRNLFATCCPTEMSKRHVFACVWKRLQSIYQEHATKQLSYPKYARCV